MTVLLTVLGVIGRILLAVLLLLLLLVLLVLFVPIRYSVNGRGDSDELAGGGEVNVSWLLKMLQLRLSIRKAGKEEDLQTAFELRIFGVNPKERRRKKAEAEKQKRIQQKKQKLEEIREQNPEHYEELKEEARIRKEEREQARLREEEVRRKAEEEQKEREAAEEKRRRKAASLKERMKRQALRQITFAERVVRAAAAAVADFFMAGIRLIIRLSGLPVRISEFCGEVMNRFFSAAGKITRVLNLLGDPRTGGALLLVKRKLFQVLRHVLPREARGELEFGLGDPALTGEAFGLASVFYPRYAGKIRLAADFDRTFVKGDLTLNGRIHLYYFVYILVSALLNRDFRYMIHLYRNRNKEETQHG
ncbi:MAG: hypothetical protein Q4B09_02970 [Lachnospiraceae bacterium]|nr:hypothetical protein [Lachnospiraceae bacterium]